MDSPAASIRVGYPSGQHLPLVPPRQGAGASGAAGQPCQPSRSPHAVLHRRRKALGDPIFQGEVVLELESEMAVEGAIVPGKGFEETGVLRTAGRCLEVDLFEAVPPAAHR